MASEERTNAMHERPGHTNRAEEGTRVSSAPQRSGEGLNRLGRGQDGLVTLMHASQNKGADIRG